MSRVLPYPLLALALLVMWLSLTSFSPGQVLLGGGIAVAAARYAGPAPLEAAHAALPAHSAALRKGHARYRSLQHRGLQHRAGARASRAEVRFRADPARAARPDGPRHPRLHRHKHARHG